MAAVVVPVDAMALLAGVRIGVGGAVPSPVECNNLLGQVRLVRGWLDAVEAHITSCLTEHHAAGQSAPAADTHTKAGRVSAAEGRRKERRSKTIKDAPKFGEALAGGEIGSEHVDALAAATSRLDDSIKAELLGQEDLLDVARSETPEKFGQTVRDRARTLEADNGIERKKQQRKQTFLSHKVNHETGMHEGRFAFHPELGSRIFSAIDRQVLKNIKAGAAAVNPSSSIAPSTTANKLQSLSVTSSPKPTAIVPPQPPLGTAPANPTPILVNPPVLVRMVTVLSVTMLPFTMLPVTAPNQQAKIEPLAVRRRGSSARRVLTMTSVVASRLTSP